jgi:hypothetical protein
VRQDCREIPPGVVFHCVMICMGFCFPLYAAILPYACASRRLWGGSGVAADDAFYGFMFMCMGAVFFCEYPFHSLKILRELALHLFLYPVELNRHRNLHISRKYSTRRSPNFLGEGLYCASHAECLLLSTSD